MAALNSSVVLFQATQNVNAAAHNAPTGLNGNLAIVSVSSVVQTINPINKICLNHTGELNLKDSISYVLYCQNDQASHAAQVAITQATVDASIERIGILFTMASLLDLVKRSAGHPTIGVRATDTLTTVQSAALANVGPYRIAADKIYSAVIADGSVRQEITQDAKYVTMAVVYNALHRHACDGHNCYTNQLYDKGSPTGKLVSVAGAHKDAFAAFMSTWGHDLWHFVDDKSIYNLAAVICGVTIPAADAAGNIVDPDQRRLNAGATYQGNAVEGLLIHEVINMSASVTDRFAPSVLGLAAIMTGLEYVVSMINSISVKVKNQKVGEITAAARALAASISASNPDRTALLQLKAILSGMMVTSFAFVRNSPSAAMSLPPHPALSKLASSRIADAQFGRDLCDLITGLEASSETIATAVSNALATISAALTAAGAVTVNGNPIATIAAIDIGEVTVPKPTAIIAADRSHESTMAMVQAMAGQAAAGNAAGGGGP
jgi:hypothetical protein